MLLTRHAPAAHLLSYFFIILLSNNIELLLMNHYLNNLNTLKEHQLLNREKVE